MFDQDEPFCNPMAPVEHQSTPETIASKMQKQNLSNEDFRKFMMTPSANASGRQQSIGFGAKLNSSHSVRGQRHQAIVIDEFKKPESKETSDKKKNKKKHYQSIKKENDEENLLAELMKKYRDRAKERRETVNEDQEQSTTTSSMNYNAVANLTSEDAAERRKQVIEESKYLGGDMEHTHLVKGLDYALLQKVKAEIEFDRDQETLELVERKLAEKRADSGDEVDDDQTELDEDEEQAWLIKSNLARNLMQILFETNLPEKNDYFLPGRLAYVFDLDNDCPTDAFTSVIRSKSECPNWDTMNTLSTSDIVLNKLIEIFEELRETGGNRRKKRLKQIEQLEDKSKFSFINQSCDFGTSSISGSSNRDAPNSIKTNRSTDQFSNDLNSIYDQDLDVEGIRRGASTTKIENDIKIFSDSDEDNNDCKSSSYRRDADDLRSNYSSRYDREEEDDTRYRSSRSSYKDRDNFKDRRRSSSRDRYSKEKDYFKRKEDRHDRRKEDREDRQRDDKYRDDRSREDRHYPILSSKKRRI